MTDETQIAKALNRIGDLLEVQNANLERLADCAEEQFQERELEVVEEELHNICRALNRKH